MKMVVRRIIQRKYKKMEKWGDNLFIPTGQAIDLPIWINTEEEFILWIENMYGIGNYSVLSTEQGRSGFRSFWYGEIVNKNNNISFFRHHGNLQYISPHPQGAKKWHTIEKEN